MLAEGGGRQGTRLAGRGDDPPAPRSGQVACVAGCLGKVLEASGTPGWHCLEALQGLAQRVFSPVSILSPGPATLCSSSLGSQLPICWPRHLILPQKMPVKVALPPWFVPSQRKKTEV